jgi:hypothetical protein
MSRALTPSELRRVKDTDQSSMSSVDPTTPPATAGCQQGYLNDDSQNSLNAEKVLEQAIRHHKQRRNQQRFGVPESLKSKSSSISCKDCSMPSSPAQLHTSPATQSDAIITTARTKITTSPPNMPVASFEVLIKELEEEEEERKRKAPITQAPKTIIQSPPPEATAVPRLRANPPSALNEAKRRSTGSILFTQPLTPTFPIDKENSLPPLMDRKASISIGGQQVRRVSVASFGSEQSDSKRNSAHELTFNFVDWNGVAGGCAMLGRQASREYNAMVRSNSAFGGELDESRRYPLAYNFGRRGSVF